VKHLLNWQINTRTICTFKRMRMILTKVGIWSACFFIFYVNKCSNYNNNNNTSIDGTTPIKTTQTKFRIRPKSTWKTCFLIKIHHYDHDVLVHAPQKQQGVRRRSRTKEYPRQTTGWTLCLMGMSVCIICWKGIMHPSDRYEWYGTKRITVVSVCKNRIAEPQTHTTSITANATIPARRNERRHTSVHDVCRNGRAATKPFQPLVLSQNWRKLYRSWRKYPGEHGLPRRINDRYLAEQQFRQHRHDCGDSFDIELFGYGSCETPLHPFESRIVLLTISTRNRRKPHDAPSATFCLPPLRRSRCFRS
jgi:hypothetical protein